MYLFSWMSNLLYPVICLSVVLEFYSFLRHLSSPLCLLCCLTRCVFFILDYSDLVVFRNVVRWFSQCVCYSLPVCFLITSICIPSIFATDFDPGWAMSVVHGARNPILYEMNYLNKTNRKMLFVIVEWTEIECGLTLKLDRTNDAIVWILSMVERILGNQLCIGRVRMKRMDVMCQMSAGRNAVILHIRNWQSHSIEIT